MSDLKINNITDRTGSCGPTIAGVSTVSTTGSFVVPVGATEFRGGRGRGIFSGGRDAPATPTAVSSIDYIEIATTGNSVSFGTLTRQGQACSSAASSTRSVTFGGRVAPAYFTTIDYVTISSSGGASDFGDLINERGWTGACGDNIRGIVAGGWAAPSMIEYVNIATTGNSREFGHLTQMSFETGNPGPGLQLIGGCASPTRGIFVAGAYSTYPGSQEVNIIQYITIQTLGDSIDFGDCTRLSYGTTASSNSTRGVFYGGRTPTEVNTIDYITIATVGNATDFGDLTAVRYDCAAVASSTRGVAAGGLGSGASSATANTIQYVTIASTGNAIDFGDMTRSNSQMAGSSDSHGGLG